MFNWLSYGNDPTKENAHIERDFFLRREWSFTIEDDIYIRYQSFRDKSEFIAAIQKRQPHKIDIGAVFSAAPKDHNTVKPELFKPVERELVFDIDMTDYDDIRTCCKGAAICKKCWPYMTMALKVIDTALREDFAFRHILWIYSGRRGIHCWVSDEEARVLPNEARAAIVDYLSVETGSKENSDKKVTKNFTGKLHPMLQRAYDILEPFFATCIADDQGQGLFATKDKYRKVLNSMPNDSIRAQLDKEWQANERTGKERWEQLKNAITAPKNPPQQAKKVKIDYTELNAWRVELVFTHCYPRLDANVSKSQNHLLKSPFCIHPKTGRVCVPIDPSYAENFDPFSVPTVRTLCAEVDEYDKLNPDTKDIPDMQKTSMKGAIEIFEKTFWKNLSSTIRKDFKDKSDRSAAMMVDF
jgi:DNA primase small subunit